jgi:hypothetical protein
MRCSASITLPCFGTAMISASLAELGAAVGGHVNCIKPSYSSPLESVHPPVAVGTRALTPQASGQRVSHSRVGTLGKAHSALPNSQSGAAAAEYGSRNRFFLASARSTASPRSSSRLQRGAGDAVVSLALHQPRVYPR